MSSLRSDGYNASIPRPAARTGRLGIVYVLIAQSLRQGGAADRGATTAAIVGRIGALINVQAMALLDEDADPSTGTYVMTSAWIASRVG